MPYIGRSTDGFGVRNRFLYLASASDTSVSGADANGATLTFTDGAYVDVYLNGVLLKAGTDYNTNTANTIAGLSALAANDEVTVVVYDVFTVGDMVSATSGGTFVGGVTFNGAVTLGSTVSGLDVNGTEIILDADADTSITADTDDQIDIKIAGADDFQFTANTFTAQSGSTIAAQALTATTITASGIVKTDDATDATTTTDGSLQTDGGLSVAKDAVIGDDVRLKSDAAVLALGADGDVTLTHEADAGLLMNTTLRDTRAVFGVNNNSNGNVSLSANDTLATITFNTTDFDVGSNVKSGNNSIFVAPVAGMYRVTGRILVQGLNSDTAYSVNLYIATRPSGSSTISYPFSTNMRGNFYSGGAQYMEINGVVAVASGTDIFLRASFPNVSNIVYYASSSACNFFVNYIGNRNNGGT